MGLSKKSIQRRYDIFSAAKSLFEEQGFEATSVDQIVQRAGVAKGTFYYYFTSKDEVLAAMVDEMDNGGIAVLQPIVDDPDLDALTKLRTTMETLRDQYRVTNSALLQFHGVTDELFYFKSLVRSIQSLTPLLGQVLAQGVAEGVFIAEEPHALAENYLTAGHLLLDSDLFPTDGDGWLARLAALQKLMECGLGLEKDTLAYIGEWRGPGAEELFS